MKQMKHLLQEHLQAIIPIYEIDDHDISLLGENSLVLTLQKYYHELIEGESKK